MKKRQRFLSFCCVLFSCLLLLSGCGNEVTEYWDEDKVYGGGHTENNIYGTNYVLYEENESLSFWINEDTTEFKVVQKSTGKEWLSTNAMRAVEGEDGALFSLVYQTPDGTQAEMDGMTYSVASGQYEITRTDTGATVTYSVGEFSGLLKIPLALPTDRFADLCDAIQDEFARMQFEESYRLTENVDPTTDEGKALLEKYPKLAEEPLYLVSEGAISTTSQKKDLVALLDQAGYTDEQYDRDKAFFTAEADEAEEPGFRIQLVYTLDEDGLTVTVPGTEMQMKQNYPLISLSLLPGFGSPNEGDEGYFLLPDGSGSLMYYYNGRLNAQTYVMPLYGNDEAKAYAEQITNYPNVSLPVFGMKNGDCGMLAIIEKGESIAEIHAHPGGDVGFPYVNSVFHLRSTYKSVLQTGNANDYFMITQNKRYQGDIRVKYTFLSGEEADYNGMASVTRAWLFGDRATLNPGPPPLVTDYVGMIQKSNQFLGFSYEQEIPTTTFAQVEESTEKLLEGGVKNLQVKLSGWFGGGLRHTFAEKAIPEEALGGKKGLSSLTAYLRDSGVGFFPDGDVQYTYTTGFGDGFTPKKDSVKLLNRAPGEVQAYNVATFQQDMALNLSKYIHNAAATDRALTGFVGVVDSYGITGLSLRNVGCRVNADYSEDTPTDRQEMLLGLESRLADLSGKYTVMTNGANGRLLPYLDYCLDVPLTSAGLDITDESVPFLQMVLGGYVRYTGSALNLAGDREGELLRMASTACGLHYTLIAQNWLETRDSHATDLYASDFGYWQESLLETVTTYQQKLDGLSGRRILRYDAVAEQVYRTTFEGGAAVYVNFSSTQKTVDGVEVPARGYTVRQAKGES